MPRHRFTGESAGFLPLRCPFLLPLFCLHTLLFLPCKHLPPLRAALYCLLLHYFIHFFWNGAARAGFCRPSHFHAADSVLPLPICDARGAFCLRLISAYGWLLHCIPPRTVGFCPSDILQRWPTTFSCWFASSEPRTVFLLHSAWYRVSVLAFGIRQNYPRTLRFSPSPSLPRATPSYYAYLANALACRDCAAARLRAAASPCYDALCDHRAFVTFPRHLTQPRQRCLPHRCGRASSALRPSPFSPIFQVLIWRMDYLPILCTTRASRLPAFNALYAVQAIPQLFDAAYALFILPH